MDISSNDVTFDIDMDMVVERANQNFLLTVSDNDSSNSSFDLSSIEKLIDEGLFYTVSDNDIHSPYLYEYLDGFNVITGYTQDIDASIYNINQRIDALFVLVFILVFVPWIKSIVRRFSFKKNKED